MDALVEKCPESDCRNASCFKSGCLHTRPAPQNFDTILHEALAITGEGGDRNDSYDHPSPNFTKIAGVWTILMGDRMNSPFTTRDVARLMMGMKLVRDSHKAKRDNLVDIAGYARAAERLAERE